MPAPRFILPFFPFAGFLAPVLLATGLPAQVPRGEFIESHCTACHDATEKKGGINLEDLKWEPADRANFDLWVRVFDAVEKGEMPPKKKKRPEEEELRGFLQGLKGGLMEVDAARIGAGGRTVLRRLNRVEYERTLHELLGISTPLAIMLPADTPMQGFDTVAEGLRFSTLQMEKYLEAADKAVADTIEFGPRPESAKDHLEMKANQEVRWHLDKPEGGEEKGGSAKHRHLLRELADGIVFFNVGYPAAQVKLPRKLVPGNYRIRIQGYGYQSKGQSIPMRIYGSNYKEKRFLGWFEMPADAPRVVELDTVLRDGEFLQIEPSNTGTDDKGQNVYHIPVAGFTGPGLALQWVEVEGPLAGTWPPRGMDALFHGIPLEKRDEEALKKNKQVAYELKVMDPKEDSRRALESFAEKAFRRPLEAGEVDRYIALAHRVLDAGKPFVDAMGVGQRAILTSPQFLLFRESPGKLDGYALAARLSYFLWSGPPDDELMRLAAEGKLAEPAVLHGQVERLLNDPRSAAFVEDFTGQWLDLRNIDATSPDEKLYPEADELLRLSMPEETRAYFTEMLKSNLPVTAVIDSDFVMINSRLAEHYEIPGVEGHEIRKVKLPPGSPRGGMLTQASILKVTANGTTTSPVLRGAWVMKRILGQPPSPPPPGVGSIEPDTRGATTVREQLAKHRSSETCAACHANIDPPGFALESFDVIGGYREKYRSQGAGETVNAKNSRNPRCYVKLGQPVDSSGEFRGQAFLGITEFKKLLLEKPDQMTKALAGKLVTYSTGAGISFSDRPALEAIVGSTKEQGGGLRTLVHQIVASPLFQSK